MTTLQAIEYLMENPDIICMAIKPKNSYDIFMRVFISGEGYKFLMCFEVDSNKARIVDRGLFRCTDKTIRERYDIPMECKWEIKNDKNLMARLN